MNSIMIQQFRTFETAQLEIDADSPTISQYDDMPLNFVDEIDEIDEIDEQRMDELLNVDVRNTDNANANNSESGMPRQELWNEVWTQPLPEPCPDPRANLTTSFLQMNNTNNTDEEPDTEQESEQNGVK